MNSYVERLKETFPKFMRRRYKPCILVFLSDKLKQVEPDIRVKIFNNFESSGDRNFRIVFYDDLKHDGEMINCFVDFLRNEEPEEIKYSSRKVLRTTNLIALLLFSQIYFEVYDFYDEPLLQIFFYYESKDEKFNFSRKFILPDHILNVSKKEQPWYLNSDKTQTFIFSRQFFMEIRKIHEERGKVVWDKIKNDEFRMMLGWYDYRSNVKDVKYYADFLLQVGRYRDAIKYYERLLSAPEINFSIKSSCIILLNVCSLLSNDVRLLTSHKYGSSLSGKVKFKYYMLRFYLHSVYRRPNSFLLEHIAAIDCNEFDVFKPFIHQQRVPALQKFRAAYCMYKAYPLYGNAFIRYKVKTLELALSYVISDDWHYLSQGLYKDYYVLSDKNVGNEFSDISQKILHQRYDKNKIIEFLGKRSGEYTTNFVDAIVLSYKCQGFSFSSPNFNMEIDWDDISSSLFKGYYSGRFDREKLQNDGVVGEPIVFTIELRYSETYISSLRLLTDGVDGECSMECIGKSSFILKFIPRNEGKLVIKGIIFSVEESQFMSLFKDSYSFSIFKHSPSILISSNNDFSTIYANEINELNLTLRSGDVDITNMIMVISSSSSSNEGIDLLLVEPKLEPYFGIYILDPMCKNTKRDLKFLLRSTLPSYNSINIFISYWNQEYGPVRYVYHRVNCMVSNIIYDIKSSILSTKVIFNDAYIEPIGFDTGDQQANKIINMFTVIDNNTITLKTFSEEKGNYNWELPQYMSKFTITPGFKIWLRTRSGFAFVSPDFQVSHILTRILRFPGGNFRLELFNSTKSVIYSLKCILCSRHAIYGKTRIVKDQLERNSQVAMEFCLVKVDDDSGSDIVLEFNNSVRLELRFDV